MPGTHKSQAKGIAENLVKSRYNYKFITLGYYKSKHETIGILAQWVPPAVLIKTPGAHKSPESTYPEIDYELVCHIVLALSSKTGNEKVILKNQHL